MEALNRPSAISKILRGYNLWKDSSVSLASSVFFIADDYASVQVTRREYCRASSFGMRRSHPILLPTRISGEIPASLNQPPRAVSGRNSESYAKQSRPRISIEIISLDIIIVTSAQYSAYRNSRYISFVINLSVII